MQYFLAIKSKENCSEALEAARRYSPNIEIVDEKTLVFDLTGSKAFEASEIAEELRKKFVSVAVSENLAAALLLAQWGREEVSGSGEKGKRKKEKGKNESRGEETQNSKPKTQNTPSESAGERESGCSSKQTWNLEPETLNRPSESAGERESGCSSEQTLNFELGTLNAQAPTILSSLPIVAIAQKQEFLELMDSWAVHDLGAFAALPVDEMVARFGLEIVELRRQAGGVSFRAPNWNVKEDKFFWSKELEGAIETIEPLNFVLSKGVARTFQNLDYVGLSTQSAKITLRGRENEKIYRIRIVFPTKNQKLWIRQIVTKIELDTPGFNIDHVEIVFRSTKPRTVQNNLYSGAILEPENLNLIVTKLKKVVGLEKIGVPRLRDAWRKRFYMTEDLSPLIAERSSGFRVQGSGEVQSEVPGSRFQVSSSSEQTWNLEHETWNSLPESAGERESGCSGKQTLNLEPGTLNPVISYQLSVSANSFYYLPQPVKARVFFEGGEPKALLMKGKRELVRTSGGPWRMDAEWYEQEEWRRDEWDIETENGAVYRVYVDKDGEAFVDGGYD